MSRKVKSRECIVPSCPNLLVDWDPHAECVGCRSCNSALPCDRCKTLSEDQFADLEATYYLGLRPRRKKLSKTAGQAPAADGGGLGLAAKGAPVPEPTVETPAAGVTTAGTEAVVTTEPPVPRGQVTPAVTTGATRESAPAVAAGALVLGSPPVVTQYGGSLPTSTGSGGGSMMPGLGQSSAATTAVEVTGLGPVTTTVSYVGAGVCSQPSVLAYSATTAAVSATVAPSLFGSVAATVPMQAPPVYPYGSGAMEASQVPPGFLPRVNFQGVPIGHVPQLPPQWLQSQPGYVGGQVSSTARQWPPGLPAPAPVVSWSGHYGWQGQIRAGQAPPQQPAGPLHGDLTRLQYGSYPVGRGPSEARGVVSSVPQPGYPGYTAAPGLAVPPPMAVVSQPQPLGHDTVVGDAPRVLPPAGYQDTRATPRGDGLTSQPLPGAFRDPNPAPPLPQRRHTAVSAEGGEWGGCVRGRCRQCCSWSPRGPG